MIGKIHLTRGKIAIVDNADLERVNQFKWQYGAGRNRKYVFRTAQRNYVRQTIYLHRFILDITDSTVQVDHLNGNTLDNRRVNLRAGTASANQLNQRCHRNGALPGARLRGFNRDGKPRWISQIVINKKVKYLGTFDTQHEAHERWIKERKRLFA